MLVFKLIHLLAVLVWVGGMFFAYVALRPAAVETLEPPLRLRLWDAVFRRFFHWVWVSVVALLASGFYMIYLYGGMGSVARHVHIMLAMGLAMMLIFGYVFFALYVPLSLNVANQRWKEAGELLGRIRKLIAVNLILGLLIVIVVIIGVA
jgi:uncharacterized membrane protein